MSTLYYRNRKNRKKGYDPVKKTASILLSLILVLGCLLSGCSGGSADVAYKAPSEPSEPSDPSESDGCVLRGEIIDVYDGSVLLCPENGELCTVGISGIPLVGEDGAELSASDISVGMLVDVVFSGVVLETYPSQLSAPDKLTVTGRSNGLVGFYFDAICDIIQDGAGLSENISVVSVDLSRAANLTDAQRAALAYMTGCKLGCDWLSLSYKELCDEGYIDSEALIFEDGVLISASTADGSVKDDRFDFDLEIWRSGLGAVFFKDCTAKLKNGVWSYEVGSYGIS